MARDRDSGNGASGGAADCCPPHAGGGLCPGGRRRTQPAVHACPSTQVHAHRPVSPPHTLPLISHPHPPHAHTGAPMPRPQSHQPHTNTLPAHLTRVTLLDILAYTHSLHKRQQLRTQTDRPTEGRAWPVEGAGRAVTQPGRPPWPPPLSLPGPVPCPRTPPPASWVAAPHSLGPRGLLEAGPGSHLGTRG